MGTCKIASAPKANKIELKTGWLKLKELIGILKPVIMTPKQIALLDCACKMAGIDSSVIKAENPSKRSGEKAAPLM